MADLVFREEPTRYRVTVEDQPDLTAEVYQEEGCWAVMAGGMVVGDDGRVLHAADSARAHLRETADAAFESARLALRRIHAKRSEEVHGG